jgi:hypothetical protein
MPEIESDKIFAHQKCCERSGKYGEGFTSGQVYDASLAASIATGKA